MSADASLTIRLPETGVEIAKILQIPSNSLGACFSFFPQQLKALGSQPDRLRGGPGWSRGGPEVRFHEGSTRFPRGSARAAGWCEH